MAIYHLSMKTVSRSEGRSSTAAAAYRAGCKIIDQRTGEIHDYTRKGGVASADIVMPDGVAPMERSAMWNAVEAAHKRGDATVAREFEIALPNELSAEERRRLAVDFAREVANHYGVAADVCVHEPSKDGDERNHHVHVLLSACTVSKAGFGKKAVELDPIHCQRQKIANPAERWRERWADLANERLREAGVEARIDHRTLEAQGIDREPTIHLGPQIMGMERRGVSSDVKKRVDAEVEARLASAKLLGELERQGQALERSIIDLSGDLAAAKASRIESKVAEHQSGMDAKLAAFEARAAALQAERDRAAAVERERVEQLRKVEQATALEKLLQERQRTPGRTVRPRGPSKDNDGPDLGI